MLWDISMHSEKRCSGAGAAIEREPLGKKQLVQLLSSLMEDWPAWLHCTLQRISGEAEIESLPGVPAPRVAHSSPALHLTVRSALQKAPLFKKSSSHPCRNVYSLPHPSLMQINAFSVDADKQQAMKVAMTCFISRYSYNRYSSL